MKKAYDRPLLEIERFSFEDVITLSTGDGINDTIIDENDDAGFIPDL